MDKMALFADLEREFTKPFGRVMAALAKDGSEVPVVDAIFFFGRSFGDDGPELFGCVAGIRSACGAQIVINGSDGERFGGTKPGEAWAGKSVWTKRLRERGITEVLTSRPAFHAKDEHEAFLDLAQAKGWRSATLVTHPHQAIRFMCGQVKSSVDRNYPIQLYAAYPVTDWSEVVHGSQGAEELPRWVHAQADVLRLIPYWLKGDLVSPRELLEYLEQRESIK